ncbi:MAG: preprotein translocase subunit YajC [Phycisphaerae bacterium]|jgi:preprotein translocase subunit YajC
MSSRIRIALVAAVAVGLFAAGAYAQASKQPAPPPKGEELKSAPKPAAETAGQPAGQPAGPTAAQSPESQPAPKGPAGGGAKSPFDNLFLPLILGVLLLMLLWSSRSRKKQEAKRQQMLAALKKGDKVTSIGGIVGTIVEVRDDEILVKVDETNNVRMRFARWAIRGTGEEAKTETPQDRK